METFYRVGKASIRIEPVQVERHSDAFVFIGGHQHRRHTSYDCYFITWEGAKRHLIERYRQEVQNAEALLRHAKNNFDEATRLAQAPKIEFGLGVGL